MIVSLVGGCAEGPRAPLGGAVATELDAALLEGVGVDGRVSPHLPIRFAAQVHNGLESHELRRLRFEVGGREFEVTRRIAPGETRRISFQWIFPEDPGWDEAGTSPEPVAWRLVGAEAVAASPSAAD